MQRLSRIPAHGVHRQIRLSSSSAHEGRPQPLILIEKATFYRQATSNDHPATSADVKLFPDLSFSVLPGGKPQWAIVGPSNAGKTTFLQVLQGKHLCSPPDARSYPFLARGHVDPKYRSVLRALRYVGFDGDRGGVGKHGARGTYMSARYESRREDEDFKVIDFLKGNIDLNPADENAQKSWNNRDLAMVASDFRLEGLLEQSMSNLSNGQIRRARIAKSVLERPLALLLDEPFMGLDRDSVMALTKVLGTIIETKPDHTHQVPRLIVALRPQDPLPKWITHIVALDKLEGVVYSGSLKDIPMATRRSIFPYEGTKSLAHHKPEPDLKGVDKDDMERYDTSAIDKKLVDEILEHHITSRGVVELIRPHQVYTPTTRLLRNLPYTFGRAKKGPRESVVEMKNVHVKYGNRQILGKWQPGAEQGEPGSGLNWTVRKGDRWAVVGPNGSGKTTLLSMICSDHPLSYSLPIKVFGRGRLPEPGALGISVFDLQSRIGQSSPEVHAFFPRSLTIRQVLESAWADTFLSTPNLTYEGDVSVDALLRWFEAELNPAFTLEGTPTMTIRQKLHALPRSLDWADELTFGESPFAAQRVALFLRAIVKAPELIILDEAFSGMDDYVRDKCILFLIFGETETIGQVAGDPLRTRYSKTPFDRDFSYSHRSYRVPPLRDDQTLICVSHVPEEVPGVVQKWLRLPESGSGQPAVTGQFTSPLNRNSSQWDEIWKPLRRLKVRDSI